MGLTARKVTTLKGAGRCGDGHGLYLQVTDAGVRSWLLRYERHGRERWMGLGPIGYRVAGRRAGASTPGEAPAS